MVCMMCVCLYVNVCLEVQVPPQLFQAPPLLYSRPSLPSNGLILLTYPLHLGLKIWSLGHGPRALSSRIHVPGDMFAALAIAPVPPLAPRPSLLCELGS